MESQWLTYAKRLQATASTGPYFSKNAFDKERYQEIAEIANEMLAKLGNVPVERIASLVSDFAQGYMTPKVDVRGAVIEGRKILLVQEKSDGCWTLPGGFADVGRSAAENVVKEIREEVVFVLQLAVSTACAIRLSNHTPPTHEISTSCSFFANSRIRERRMPAPR